jgi:hypothetical protein
MSYLLDSYFDKASDFLYPWKSTKEECTSRWSLWSPVFTTAAGRPFQVRVNLDSHIVEFSVENVTMASSSLEQVSNYMKEVLNDNSVS